MQKFSDSFDELLQGITDKLGVVAARQARLAANPLAQGLGLRRKPDPCALVIFGASGDLTKRKLFPALYSLAYRRPAAGAVRGRGRRADGADDPPVRHARCGGP